MDKHKEKSKPVIYLEFVPFWILYKLIHLMPLQAAYALGRAMFKLLFLIDVRHRRRAVQHLLHAGVAKTPQEARRIAARTYAEFSKLLVEIVKMDQCYDPAKISLVGSPSTIDAILPHDDENRNVIIVTAHYGNWEVAGTAFSHKVQRKMLSIMRPFANPLIGEMILDHRRSDVHEVVNKENGLRSILKALHDGKNVSILIDQHASRSEGVETIFFGHPCRTHMTPALLHLKTGIPIMPELTRRVGDFEFEMVVGDLIRHTPTGDKERDIREVTQRCTTALEKLIAEQPDQWLWAARRWLDINRGPYQPPLKAENAPASGAR